MNRIVLASKSIGRKYLFDMYFSEYIIHPSNANETINNSDPIQTVINLADQKAKIVSELYIDDFVFGFDTVVLFNNSIIGKPENIEEGKKFLKMLSNNKQSVLSGYSIINKKLNIYITGYDETVLFFKELTDDFINNYVLSHDITKYAGGYAYQNNDKFIDIISGTEDTIIGAPMKKIIEILKSKDISLKPYLKSSN